MQRSRVIQPGPPATDPNTISIRHTRFDDVDVLREIAAKEIGPNVADCATIRRVIAFNGELIFTVLRAAERGESLEIVGFSAQLPLNRRGLEALLDGRFNDRDPSLTMLCAPTDAPAALFGWGVVARGIHRIVAPLVGRHLMTARYAGLDFYSRGTTPAGVRSLVNMGAVPVHPDDDPAAGCLMVFRRQQRSVA